MSQDPNYEVGEKATTKPVPTQYQVSPKKIVRPPEPYRFEVNLVAEANYRQKKTGVVWVEVPGFSPAKLYCDEQPPVGENSSPPPLAYFAAGVGFCLMTHLTDILTAKKLQIDSLKLEQRIRFRTNLAHMREHGYMTEGGCEMVETHVLIEGTEPDERVQDLLDEAEGACMAHFALRNPVPWSTRLVYNGSETSNKSGN